MSCYFIVETYIGKERGDYEEYITRVKPIVESYGGIYLVRSGEIQQYQERPIPNFYTLVNRSVEVHDVLRDQMRWELEEGLTIRVLESAGHSDGSLSFYLEEEGILFSGDAIPVPGDIPIYTSMKKSIETLEKFAELKWVDQCCPAWDRIYEREEFPEILAQARGYLNDIDCCLRHLRERNPEDPKDNIFESACKELGMQNFKENPLFKTSFLRHLEEIS